MASILPPGNIGNLAGKIALITGASSGIGRAIAQAYAEAGAFIVSADLTPNPPDAPIVAETLKGTDLKTPTVDLINAKFLLPADSAPTEASIPHAVYVQCDVTQQESVEAAVKFTVQTYGRLEIMVNNAGISAESNMPSSTNGADVQPPRIHNTDVSVLDRSLAINVRGVWLGCKYAIAQFLEQEPHPSGDRGWIINLSSICGLVGIAGSSSYCASKGAVLQLTRVVALEYAKDRIHCNCINPGFVETNFLEPLKRARGKKATTAMLEAIHPWGRIGRPQDIAKMALFLAGDGASWCTGQAYIVDGGYTAQ